ncbi:MAG: nucleotidyl transferase AbiEii/AbiGii toxin family protein [Verrucomicrobia bacterium]|nr:nucleotidyl transferase AbiEii/AbiGii toxin family protein [Verrucomicrobiota bacterium]
MLHPEVLPDHSLALLKNLSSQLEKSGFYLAGGTALALRLGHRVSIDLDFFSEQPFDSAEMLTRLEAASRSELVISQQTSGSLCATVDGTKVEFFHYPYPLLVDVETLEGVRFCSLADNGAMKMSAMTNRGSKKDFIDMVALLEIDPLGIWLDHFGNKYPRTDIFTVIKSLTWFEEAEMEPDPTLLHQQTWELVKRKITDAVASL